MPKFFKATKVTEQREINVHFAYNHSAKWVYAKCTLAAIPILLFYLNKN